MISSARALLLLLHLFRRSAAEYTDGSVAVKCTPLDDEDGLDNWPACNPNGAGSGDTKEAEFLAASRICHEDFFETDGVIQYTCSNVQPTGTVETCSCAAILGIGDGDDWCHDHDVCTPNNGICWDPTGLDGRCIEPIAGTATPSDTSLHLVPGSNTCTGEGKPMAKGATNSLCMNACVKGYRLTRDEKPWDGSAGQASAARRVPQRLALLLT